MDSKQLFRAYQSKYYLTSWLNENGELAQNDGEVKWIYCGLKEEFKKEIVSQFINNTFTDDEVYLCISSNKSSLVTKSIVVDEIANVLHKKEIGVIDKAFTKMMELKSIGVFKLGIIRDFPKNRPKPVGEPLKVAFHANTVSNSTTKVSDIIRNHFDYIEKSLHKDYGGNMEHLWIDLELVEHYKPYPFRFQKRVENSTSYTEFYSYNVGHYSIEPDYKKLSELTSEKDICNYIFGLWYDSTQVLVDKQKKLGGFNATQFRLDFLTACEKLGFSLKP